MKIEKIKNCIFEFASEVNAYKQEQEEQQERIDNLSKFTIKIAKETRELEKEQTELIKALEVCEAWIVDGGHAEHGSGRDVYLQLQKVLNQTKI